MSKGAAIAVAVAVLAGIWFWHESTSSNIPDVSVLQTLAEDEWDHEWCADRDMAWPCFVTTEVALDRSTYPTEGAESYHVCWSVYGQLETTPWDAGIGGPASPRTYTPLTTPIRACATVQQYMAGSTHEANSWSLNPDKDRMFPDLTIGVAQLLCANVGDPSCPA